MVCQCETKVLVDIKNVLDTAYEEGSQARAMSIARALKALGEPTEKIARVTNLAPDVIEGL